MFSARTTPAKSLWASWGQGKQQIPPQCSVKYTYFIFKWTGKPRISLWLHPQTLSFWVIIKPPPTWWWPSPQEWFFRIWGTARLFPLWGEMDDKRQVFHCTQSGSFVKNIHEFSSQWTQGEYPSSSPIAHKSKSVFPVWNMLKNIWSPMAMLTVIFLFSGLLGCTGELTLAFLTRPIEIL